MVRLWATLLTGALVLVLSFQNCGEQKAATPAANGTDLTVDDNTQTGDEQTQTGDETGDTTTPPPAFVLRAIEFGYSPDTDTYLYSMIVVNGQVSRIADGQVVRTLDNASLSALANYINTSQVVTSGNFNNPMVCDPADDSKVYGRLVSPDAQQILLNSDDIAMGCGQDFGDLATKARTSFTYMGNMVTMQEFLAALQADIETTN